MKKILVVDDELDVCDILSKKLLQNGFDVKVLTSGKDVLSQCRVDKPDCILLDVVLKDTDGYTVSQDLRQDEALCDIPIIFMTGKDLDVSEMAKISGHMGKCDFITKPCAFADVLEKIKEFI
ncbi:MAG: response regulator [Candidatus Omnitrophica bacterium]|jgi:two-component system alkaline phosphatase synthesis response regulator PhoP|nr:response regulator [Candidatus Omnitrophota bacterium]